MLTVLMVIYLTELHALELIMELLNFLKKIICQ